MPPGTEPMDLQRILGIVLLVGGTAFLVFGLIATDSLTESVTEGLTGKFTDKTTWYLVGGLAGVVAGAAMMMIGRTAKAA